MAVDRKQQIRKKSRNGWSKCKGHFTSEMYTTYLRTMYNYSFKYAADRAMQRPDATLVAGV